jgi:hypothetical protein
LAQQRKKKIYVSVHNSIVFLSISPYWNRRRWTNKQYVDFSSGSFFFYFSFFHIKKPCDKYVV